MENIIKMESKYAGKCGECGQKIYIGETMFFFPDNQGKERAKCEYCGEQDYKYSRKW